MLSILTDPLLAMKFLTSKAAIYLTWSGFCSSATSFVSEARNFL